jgi:hypothetical protein
MGLLMDPWPQWLNGNTVCEYITQILGSALAKVGTVGLSDDWTKFLISLSRIDRVDSTYLRHTLPASVIILLKCPFFRSGVLCLVQFSSELTCLLSNTSYRQL